MEKEVILNLNEIRNLDDTSFKEHDDSNVIDDNSDSADRTLQKVSTCIEKSEVDGRGRSKNEFASKKMIAEGMMDIALLTANANQLRFLITYNNKSKTYYVNMALIILSLVLQVAIGIALIFKRHMKNCGKRHGVSTCSMFMVVGVFIVTVINVFVAAFTTTDSVLNVG